MKKKYQWTEKYLVITFQECSLHESPCADYIATSSWPTISQKMHVIIDDMNNTMLIHAQPMNIYEV